MVESSLIPGLTDDVADLCLSRVPRSSFRVLSQVCRRWNSFLRSDRAATLRKLTGLTEQYMCVLMESRSGRDVYWEIFDKHKKKLGRIAPVPGPIKRGFGVAVLDGWKIVFFGGYTSIDSTTTISASSDVYEFDPASNRWRKLADVNIPRYDFAFAEVDGLLYAIRGYSSDGRNLCNAEVYNPETNQWSVMDCLYSPSRSFAFSLCSKLYVIGNGARFMGIYDPKTQTWEELKSEESLSVYSYTVVRNKAYFLDKNLPGYVRVFDPEDNSWSLVVVPSRYGGFLYRLGAWNNKVVLFSRICGCETLMNDFDKEKGSKWIDCYEIKPSGSSLISVIINF
ncbi:unnamed protein product [Cochlearia groenlandica]